MTPRRSPNIVGKETSSDHLRIFWWPLVGLHVELHIYYIVLFHDMVWSDMVRNDVRFKDMLCYGREEVCLRTSVSVRYVAIAALILITRWWRKYFLNSEGKPKKNKKRETILGRAVFPHGLGAFGSWMLAPSSHFRGLLRALMRHVGAKMATKSVKMSRHRRKSAPRSRRCAQTPRGEWVCSVKRIKLAPWIPLY